MTRIWNLDQCCPPDEVDVAVYLPGPPGPPLIDVGSIADPVSIDLTGIDGPQFRRQRSFIQATNAEVDQPVMQNPSDNGPWELWLYVVGGFAVVLNNASNIKLSGQWVGTADSIIYFQWDGVSRWVEGGRNEI